MAECNEWELDWIWTPSKRICSDCFIGVEQEEITASS